MRPCSPASILCRHFASLHLLPGVGRVELDSRFRRVEEGHEPRPHYVDKSKRDAQDPEGRRHDGGGGGLVRVVCTVSSVWCGVGGTILRRVDLSEILWTVSASSCTAVCSEIADDEWAVYSWKEMVEDDLGWGRRCQNARSCGEKTTVHSTLRATMI